MLVQEKRSRLQPIDGPRRQNECHFAIAGDAEHKSRQQHAPLFCIDGGFGCDQTFSRTMAELLALARCGISRLYERNCATLPPTPGTVPTIVPRIDGADDGAGIFERFVTAGEERTPLHAGLHAGCDAAGRHA